MRDRSDIVSQATFLLAHIANSGPVPLSAPKFKNSNASFKANSEKVSINRAALIDLGPTIRGKVRAYQADYLSSILDV
jgi:hypothetical protein